MYMTNDIIIIKNMVLSPGAIAEVVADDSSTTVKCNGEKVVFTGAKNITEFYNQEMVIRRAVPREAKKHLQTYWFAEVDAGVLIEALKARQEELAQDDEWARYRDAMETEADLLEGLR